MSMVAIKGMEMPKSCYDCDFCFERHDYYCAISKKRLAKKITDIPNENRPSDCPLVKIVTCKDCKYWHDDGIMTTCDKNIGHGFPRDYFCASAERRE